MAREVEIKLAVKSAASARALLRRHGFLVIAPRVFETNTLYDTSAGDLRARGEILRLREIGRRTVVTFKGPPLTGRHKIREELEFESSSSRQTALVWERLGFAPSFRYEKYRTELQRPREPGHVTLDETPIGIFLELEGPPAWIDRTARRLGFPPEAYITKSYGTLYLETCVTSGIRPSHMVFRRSLK